MLVHVTKRTIAAKPAEAWASAARHNARVQNRGMTPPNAEPAGLPPHAPLTQYYGDEDEHQRFVRGMFDDTAPDYDRVEHMLALGAEPDWCRACT
jgi:hypothetical protein